MGKGCVSLQTVSHPGDTVRQSKSAAGLRDGGPPPCSPQGNSKSQGNNNNNKKKGYSNRAECEGARLRVRPCDLIYLYVTGGVFQN